MQRDDQDPYADPLPEDPTPTVPQSVLDAKPLDPSDPNFNPNVNTPTTWDPNTSAPKDTFAGWQWDPKMARYMKSDTPPADTSTTPPPDTSSKTPPPTTSTTPPPTTTTKSSTTPAPAATIPLAQPSGSASSTAITAPAATPAGPAPTPPSVSTPVDPADKAYKDSIRSALLNAINQPGVSMNDPDIAPAITANRVSQERLLQQQRDAIAERLNAQGLAGSGALDQQMAAAFEQTGANEGQFAGNAVLQQALARRQQLISLLSTGASMLTAQEAKDAQLKIADLDAFLRQQSITNQDQQANTQMGLTGGYYEALLRQQQIRDLFGV